MMDDPLLGAASRLAAQIIHEDDAWAITLPHHPFAAEETIYAVAVSEIIESLREYAADWKGHPQAASNHAGNHALVRLVEASTDDQLANWLVGGHPRTRDK